MMTEKEAAEKWCPHVRQSDGPDVPVFNRGVKGNAHNDHENNRGALCNCIGSACMAWRWVWGDNKKGFCGLAGRP